MRFLLLVAFATLAGCSRSSSSSTPEQKTAPEVAKKEEPKVEVRNIAPQEKLNGPPPQKEVVQKEPTHPDSKDWVSLMSGIDVEQQAIAGNWKKTPEGLRVDATEGARLSLPAPPSDEYDFRVTFTRHNGVHSIALIFAANKRQATFEVDAWGEHLGGIQNIQGKTIQENLTRTTNLTLKNEQRYTMIVEVRREGVKTLLNGEVVAMHRTDGSDLSLPDLWSLPYAETLGIGAWDSETTFHAIEVKPISPRPEQIAKFPENVQEPNGLGPNGFAPKGFAPKVLPRKLNPDENPMTPPKRVLIVIANHHFFYREYADPRAELEKAGFKVIVAAGKKEPCTPHSGSGEGADRGIVQPDLALSEVKAEDFDAILFAGGWGASSYQYAFTGRYDEASYNSEKPIRDQVNRIINEGVSQDKFLAALCNGVSVLAWARVNGKSPLAGKKVCAPVREAPAGIYNGKRAQPSCRWHPEANGAILSPPGSIGRPNTAEDDVCVDGKIITGEDDISAREMGRKLVEVLTK
jgi:putative intracellular protease/amidase